MTDPTATPEDNSAAPEGTAAAPELTLEQLVAERNDYMDKWARTRADLDNYRRRIQREMEEDRKYAALPLLKAILPGFDNLQRAIKAAESTRNAEELITGIALVTKQFEAALASQGVTTIPAVGLPFDPNVHEAITQAPSADHPPMTVLQEVEQGIQLHDRVVRPAKVIVSTNG